MSAQPFSLAVAVLFSSMVVVRGHAAEEAPHLTTEDRKYLDGLMREFVFDPKGAGVLKGDEKKQQPRHVVIVQVEVSPDGQVTYGVIMKEVIRAVAARELTAIKAFAELDKEEQDAADNSAGKKD
jgi:hypothetical protein